MSVSPVTFWSVAFCPCQTSWPAVGAAEGQEMTFKVSPETLVIVTLLSILTLVLSLTFIDCPGTNLAPSPAAKVTLVAVADSTVELATIRRAVPGFRLANRAPCPGRTAMEVVVGVPMASEKAVPRLVMSHPCTNRSLPTPGE